MKQSISITVNVCRRCLLFAKEAVESLHDANQYRTSSLKSVNIRPTPRHS